MFLNIHFILSHCSIISYDTL